MSRNKPQTLVDALRFFGNLHVACQTKTPFYMRIAQHSIDRIYHLLGIFSHTSSLRCYSLARRIVDHEIVNDGRGCFVLWCTGEGRIRMLRVTYKGMRLRGGQGKKTRDEGKK